MSLTEQREGIEAGRLDMFVDGAFAFILTLLLIGGESIPDSTDKLLLMLGGIPAFAVCFFQIAFFWHGHVRWRKRCHGADATGRWLSLLLVFFAMIFVYPLHMVFSGAVRLAERRPPAQRLPPGRWSGGHAHAVRLLRVGVCLHGRHAGVAVPACSEKRGCGAASTIWTHAARCASGACRRRSAWPRR